MVVGCQLATMGGEHAAAAGLEQGVCDSRPGDAHSRALGQ